MLKPFREFAEKHYLIPQQGKVVLAVSGGADSVVMTHLFHLAEISCVIAHCNFQLRGAESDEDESFVREMGASYGMEVLVRRFDTRAEVADSNVSVQMAARNLRFRWFENLLENPGYELVAAGHHLDDQVETFFINLLRGTGISGLRSILPKQQQIIHPLLFATRKQIEGYAKEQKLAFRSDSSNASVKYQRNKIRHELLPVLEQIAPGYQEVFRKSFRHLRDAEAVLNNCIDQRMEGLVQVEGDTLLIEKRGLLQLKDHEEVMRIWLQRYGFHEETVCNITGAMSGQAGKQFFSPTHRLTVDRKYVVLEPVQDAADGQEILIEEDTSEVSRPVGLRFTKQPLSTGFVIQQDCHIATLDWDKLRYPLRLRRWRQGDAFVPLGMQGRKKVSDFFTDIKLSVPQKERVWLLVSDEDIVWIVGHRIDDRYRVTGQTKQVLQIELLGKKDVK